jgi:hypothetical protein
MVNRYNISIIYKLKYLQNDPWVRKNITIRQQQKSKRRCGSIGTTGGKAGLASFFSILLIPLILTPTFNSI